MKPLSEYIGHSYEKYNCLKLVQEFYKDQFGLEVRNYFEGEVPSREDVVNLIITNKGEFLKVENPSFGDIVIIKLYGVECHIGVVVDAKYFIHSAKRIGSCMERLSRYRHMIAGYYRHQEFAT